MIAVAWIFLLLWAIFQVDRILREERAMELAEEKKALASNFLSGLLERIPQPGVPAAAVAVPEAPSHFRDKKQRG